MKKGGNTSSAVMNQRIDPTNSLDDYPTPSWAGRALLKYAIAPLTFEITGKVLSDLTAWEPACNRGYLARPLREAFGDVLCTDIHDYGWAGMDRQLDFLAFNSLLDDNPPPQAGGRVDWIITNPPFVKGIQFIERCFDIGPRVGFAMILRNGFLDGEDRYERLYSRRAPTWVVHYADRVTMLRGRIDPKKSTATTYCWLIWMPGVAPQPPMWIPKCRKQLQRPGDVDWQKREGFDG